MRPELDKTATAPPGAAAAASSAPGPDGAPKIPAGRQLGHYRIERPLGAGGMGEVYLATDLALDRPVAVKVLPEEVARDPARRERLVREARSQARVLHPNVGHIYFIGEDAGLLYFAMEYVPGETLGERVAKGPMPVDEALALIRAAALGLREAQRSGITHRDIKPSNLMLDGHSVVKVLDFGLAATAPGATATDGPVAQTSMAGTPLYMAPEQGRGEAIDFRADIYALGATLYHLVSGRPPFVADSVAELMSLHASAKRPLVPKSTKQPRLAISAVDALCARMMAPRPEDRFASYDELVHALELASTVHTKPAGFWVRFIAAGIDMMLFALVTVLGSLGIVVVVGREPASLDPFIYGTLLLYAVISVRRWGKTIGKALFELEVADLETGGRPSWRAASIRAGVQLGLPILAGIGTMVCEMLGLDHKNWDRVTVFSLLLLVLVVAIGVWRSPGKRALWDRAAGTIVRYRK